MTSLLFPNRQRVLRRLNQKLSGPHFRDAKFFILVDENTYNHCLPLLVSEVEMLHQAEFLEVPVGEEAKSLEIAAQLWQVLQTSMAEQCLGRNDLVIVNLGGGCVSDIGGFVAAGLKRGVRYINVPTTLVGMVDAAIGGKTAVNLCGAKNQVGFFHQPELTVIEPAFLDTLPEAELKNGLFEMVKTLAIGYPDLYRSFLANPSPLDPSIIRECATIKDCLVRRDHKEHRIRKIFNLGHTFGHAIEAHNALPHGQAVGIGMACAYYLSVKKLGLPQQVLTDYLAFLRPLVELPKYSLKDTEALLALMRQDKKCSDGLILCVLMQELGAPVINVPVDENEIRDTLLSLHKL